MAKMISVPEAAEFCKVSTGTILGWISKHVINGALRQGRAYILPQTEATRIRNTLNKNNNRVFDSGRPVVRV